MSTGFVSALDRDRDQDTESEDSESEGESEASAEANGGALIVEDHAPGAGDGVARFPAQEIVHRSKISCLSWNSHVKNHLLSSDYEGVVSLWDSEVGSLIHNYNEHEKRAWSVDFSVVDTHTFASGGDDTKVKLWSTQLKNSIATIPTKANICSVRFNPKTANQIAFGSAGILK